MKQDTIVTRTDNFESHAQETEDGVEFWLARDLQHLLGYSEWRNFLTAISRAKTACDISGHAIADHFVDVNKMVDLGSGSLREIADMMLTRGIRPEKLPPAEDIKKVERRLAFAEKKSLANPDSLSTSEG